jgi:hypothetical protein
MTNAEFRLFEQINHNLDRIATALEQNLKPIVLNNFNPNSKVEFIMASSPKITEPE